MNIIRGTLRGVVFVCAIGLGLTGAVLVRDNLPKSEPVRISMNLGGKVFEFIENFSKARVEKTTFMLDGLCVSACTMITGEIPNDRVCVTPYAKLAFHAAFFQGPMGEREFSPEGTELLWRIYPEWVRSYLQKQGWTGPDKDQPTLIWMEAKDLLLVYKLCPTN